MGLTGVVVGGEVPVAAVASVVAGVPVLLAAADRHCKGTTAVPFIVRAAAGWRGGGREILFMPLSLFFFFL